MHCFSISDYYSRNNTKWWLNLTYVMEITPLPITSQHKTLYPPAALHQAGSDAAPSLSLWAHLLLLTLSSRIPALLAFCLTPAEPGWFLPLCLHSCPLLLTSGSPGMAWWEWGECIVTWFGFVCLYHLLPSQICAMSKQNLYSMQMSLSKKSPQASSNHNAVLG